MADVIVIVVVLAILGALLASPFLLIKWLRGRARRVEATNEARLAAERVKTAAGVPGKPERAFLKSCTHCGAFLAYLPFRDRLGRTYCSAACMRWLGEGPRDFCHKCASETEARSSGNQRRFNGIGTGFLGSSDPCQECASVVRRVWLTVFYLPVIPLEKYRVLQVSPEHFYSRRLRSA